MLDFCNDCNPLVFGNLKKNMYDCTDSCMMEYIFWIKLSYQMNSERYLKQNQKKNNKKIVIIYAWP